MDKDYSDIKILFLAAGCQAAEVKVWFVLSEWVDVQELHTLV